MENCRKCTACEGMSHHWLPDPNPELETDYCCKHCDARGDECPSCSDTFENDHCETCNGESVIASQQADADKPGGKDLTSLSAALLMGNHLTPLRNVCTDQITVSTHKLQKLVDELQEHDRKLAVALIGVRDQLSPDDNSDTVPMPRELTKELADKIFVYLPITWIELNEIYSALVAHFHPVSDEQA